MNNNLDFFLNQQTQLNVQTFFEGLITSCLLSLLIQLVYLRFSSSLSNKTDFSKNFMVLGIATTLVITIVKSSLALSLGLVGALSIVRFRAAIKDPEELVYLFLVISVGIGCGAGQIQISIMGSIFAVVVIILYSTFFRRRKLLTGEVLNSSFVFEKKISEKSIKEIIKLIDPLCTKINFISLSYSLEQTTLNLDLIPKKFDNILSIEKIVKKHDRKVKIMFARENFFAL